MNTIARQLSCTLAVGFIIAVGATGVAAQAKYLIWDGSYTAAQAERGKTAYATHCVACHGTDDKGGKAAALSGDLFWLHWETKTVEGLFHKIRDTMPRGAAGSEPAPVSENAKLDIVAYLLQRNGLPAGNGELTADPVLAKLEIVPQTGPSPPRNGSMVQVIGCLESRENRWFLANGTEPKKTTFETSADERKTAASTTPGSTTVELISVFPSPAPHVGHRLFAKGLFIKNAAGDKINVMSLEMVAETCSN